MGSLISCSGVTLPRRRRPSRRPATGCARRRKQRVGCSSFHQHICNWLVLVVIYREAFNSFYVSLLSDACVPALWRAGSNCGETPETPLVNRRATDPRFKSQVDRTSSGGRLSERPAHCGCARTCTRVRIVVGSLKCGGWPQGQELLYVCVCVCDGTSLTTKKPRTLRQVQTSAVPVVPRVTFKASVCQ